MPQFSTFGELDDLIADDGDRGFVAVNQRLQLNQLEPGMVRESINGRMEGFWKPRKNVISVSGPLTTGGGALRLPFLIFTGGAPPAISSIDVTSGLVTITTATPHGITVGESGYSCLIGITGDASLNGIYVITATDTDEFTFTHPSAGDGSYGAVGFVTTPPINDFAASEVQSACVFSDPNSENDESIIVAMETTARKLNLSTFPVTIETLSYPNGVATDGVNDMLQAFDKVILLTNGTRHLEWHPAGRQPTAASRATNVVTITLKNHGYTVGTSVNVTGLADGTPPVGDFTITTITADTFTFADTGADEAYNVDDAIVKGGFSLAPSGLYQQPGIINGSNNTTITQGEATVTSPAPHNLIPGDEVVVIRGTEEITQGLVFIVASTPSPNVFTYYIETPRTNLFVDIVSWDRPSGSSKPVTVTTKPSSFVVGDVITITDAEEDVDANINGSQTISVVNSPTSFEIGDVIAGTASKSGGAQGLVSRITNLSIEYTKRRSSGLGFSHQPGAPWGHYFQRRLWVPYYYDITAGSTLPGIPVHEFRGITDEIIASDILDSDTYDRIANQFRISGGSADHVVAMHGFYDDSLIVFNRNSIHIVAGTQGSLNDTVVKELTREVGCLARKSVIIKGNAVLFLADEGIYGLEFLDEYNLRGTEEPLSKAIQPYIDRINKDLSDRSAAVYFDNRYYIAVPLDSAPGADDAIGNNAILVYNFLNKGWESLDTFGTNNFLIKEFFVARAGVRNNLYAITSNGGLHQMEANESAIDYLSVSTTDTVITDAEIDAKLVSRGYDMGTLERKRFTDVQIQMQTLPNQTGEFNIGFGAEDPDRIEDIGSTSDFLGGILAPDTADEGETANIRARIGGIRGYTGTISLNRTVGSSKIHSIKVAGSVANRQILSQK